MTALGPPPDIDAAKLRQSLTDHGLADADLSIRLIVGGTRFCPAGGGACVAPTAGVP